MDPKNWITTIVVGLRSRNEVYYAQKANVQRRVQGQAGT